MRVGFHDFLNIAKDQGIPEDERLKVALSLSVSEISKLSALLEEKDLRLKDKETCTSSIQKAADLQDKLRAMQEAELLTKLSKYQAVLANRMVVEVGMKNYEKLFKRLEGWSLSRLYRDYRDNNIYDMRQGRNEFFCHQSMTELSKYKLCRDESDVCKEFTDLMHEVSKPIHYPEDLPFPGFYVGGVQPKTCALAILVLQLQKDNLIDDEIHVLDQNHKAVCTLIKGKVKPFSVASRPSGGADC